MFRALANLFSGADLAARSRGLFAVHPAQLARFLEDAWRTPAALPPLGGLPGGAPFLGDPSIVGALQLPTGMLPSGIVPASPDTFTDPGVNLPPLVMHHLMYAYLIESSGVLEIVAEVLRRVLRGESLPQLRPATLAWARSTEDLFYSAPPSVSILKLTSELRPSSRVTRRNAYWRMFGMDLSHDLPARWSGGQGGADQWKAEVGSGVNAGFREKLSELFRQVWLGLENRTNQIGANATDDEYVALLCTALHDMMRMRRRGGAIAREEFVAVATMSWFHLTVEVDSPIVVDLRAEASDPAERLARLADVVGMKPATRARELFELSELLSGLLRSIEVGLFNNGTGARTLYADLGAANQALRTDMNRIIDLWQSATGERVKDRPVGTTTGTLSAQPLRIPKPAEPVSTNGARG
jgi:hypothetical protein